MTGTGAVGSGYGELRVTSLVVLGAVCVAAYVAVRFASRLFATARPENRQELTETVLKRAGTAADSSRYRAFVDAFLDAAADPQHRARALELVPPLSFDHVVIPIVLARLRAREASLALLERMLDRHDVFLPEVLRHPELEWLHDERRFGAVWRAVFRTGPPGAP